MKKGLNIVPCLWFDDQAEEAARYYVGIFKKSRIVTITRYGEAGRDIHQRPAGSVMTVEFELNGQQFTALNGGPLFKFSEAISFQVMCGAQQRGWLKDKYGLSWQVIPKPALKLLADPKSKKSQRAFSALMQMKKLDLAALKRAYDGKT